MINWTKLKYILLTMSLIGCQTVPSDPEASLRIRVLGYFDALEEQDYRTAYEYLTPGYRSAHSVLEYVQLHRPPGRHSEPEIQQIECPSADVCEVMVASRFEFDKSVHPVGGLIVPMQTSDRWLVSEGMWYLVPKR